MRVIKQRADEDIAQMCVTMLSRMFPEKVWVTSLHRREGNEPVSGIFVDSGGNYSNSEFLNLFNDFCSLLSLLTLIPPTATIVLSQCLHQSGTNSYTSASAHVMKQQ